MKNKNLIVYIAIGLIIIIGVTAFVFFGRKSASSSDIQTSPEEVVSAMKPEEIGLTLTAAGDNHKLILEIAKTENISKLDYELDYTKKGDIPTGVIGNPQVKPGLPFKQEIVLGTCSDVCHYDEDVSNIKLVVKVTKTDGTVAQVEKTLELSE
jgi:hypothetical protein